MAAAQVYSEEKAQRLVRTFGATLSFSLLIGWFEIMILRPGIDMKVEMVRFCCYCRCRSGFWDRSLVAQCTLFINTAKVTAIFFQIKLLLFSTNRLSIAHRNDI